MFAGVPCLAGNISQINCCPWSVGLAVLANRGSTVSRCICYMWVWNKNSANFSFGSWAVSWSPFLPLNFPLWEQPGFPFSLHLFHHLNMSCLSLLVLLKHLALASVNFYLSQPSVLSSYFMQLSPILITTALSSKFVAMFGCHMQKIIWVQWSPTWLGLLTPQHRAVIHLVKEQLYLLGS